MVGCKDKAEIQVYRVSKPESPQPPDPGAGMGEMPSMGAPMAAAESAPSGGQASPVVGNPPAGWEAQPLSSMRQASFAVSGDNGAVADISLVVLSGAAGGTLDNVNRWLAQLGQPAITEAGLAQRAERVSTPLGDVVVVDLEGLPAGADPAKDGRILAGIAAGDGGTYFFKMRGNAALVASQKAGFLDWIRSIRPATPAGSPP
jgi:hypothetical protein